MLFYEGLTCPVCKKNFDKNDDVVACPQCGLPHHRACWKEIGHCQQADKHGTDEQWSRQKLQAAAEPVRQSSSDVNENICPNCHTRNKEYAEFCNHCGSPLETDDWHSSFQQEHVGEYTPFHSFHPMGEIYTDTERIGSASARDLAALVGTNTVYYIPRFRQIAAGAGGGWNWAAFLLGPYWLMFRKQYVAGTALLLLQLFYSLFANYWMNPYLSLAPTASDAEILQVYETLFSSSLFLPIMVLSVVMLAIHVILGLQGNALYRYTCEKMIVKAKQETPDISSAELAAMGGTSIVAATLSYFLPQMIVSVLSALLTL